VWATNPAEDGGGVGRVFLGLDLGGRGRTRADAGGRGWTRVDAGGRGLHGKGGTNVVELCSAESVRGYGGVYPDIDKVAMQEL
jgi:hypothetical protein